MLIAIISVAALLLLPISVYLFSKVEEENGRRIISIDALDDLPLDNPPVIVSQMKGGEVQQTLCYFLPQGVATEAATVEEGDVRDRLLAKLQLDNTITITA